MPRVGYSDEFTGNSGADKFPRVKLNKDERRRLGCIEAPWSEWVHELRAPTITNGEPEMETKSRRDKSTYEAFKMQYISNPICLGDQAALSEKGVDPANCPACEASMNQSSGVAAPKRRYAMNVISYQTMPGAAFQLSVPFSAQILVWAFTPPRYDKLLGFQKQWGNLREHDILLGPCEDAVFQRYEMQVAQEAAWATNPQTQQWIGQLWTAPGNRATDEQLRDACGRSSPIGYMQQDVLRVMQLTSMAAAAGARAAGGQFAGQPQPGMQQGFSDLLQSAPAAHPLAQQAMQQGQPDPFGGQPGFAPQQPQAAPQQAMQPGQPDPFGGQPGFPGQQPQAAPQQFQPQQPQAQPALAPNPFGGQPPAPAQASPQFGAQGFPAQAFPGQQPQGGVSEFTPGGTTNPSPAAQQFQQQAASPQMQPQFTPQQPGPFVQAPQGMGAAPAMAGPAFPSSQAPFPGQQYDPAAQQQPPAPQQAQQPPQPQAAAQPVPVTEGAPTWDTLFNLQQGQQ